MSPEHSATNGATPRLEISRAYDDSKPGTYRVLVDRLWPRGITKQRAALGEWLKDVAPSAELRRWYAHEPSRFASFTRRYRAELARRPASDAVARLLLLAETRTVTLVTATRDLDHSGAMVLYEYVAERLPTAER
jgi:uncharacterized protein YeaO (DUF488 family)